MGACVWGKMKTQNTQCKKEKVVLSGKGNEEGESDSQRTYWNKTDKADVNEWQNWEWEGW